MATVYFNIIPSKLMESSQAEQFVVSAPQANTVQVVLDACVVTNIGSVAATFNFNLIPNNGSVSTSNRLINQKRLEPGESYLCPELLGQVLEEGAVISTLASASNTLAFSLSGRQITT